MYSRQADIFPSRNSATPTTTTGPNRLPSLAIIQSSRSVNTTSSLLATWRYSTSRLASPIESTRLSSNATASSGPVVVGNPLCCQTQSSVKYFSRAAWAAATLLQFALSTSRNTFSFVFAIGCLPRDAAAHLARYLALRAEQIGSYGAFSVEVR